MGVQNDPRGFAVLFAKLAIPVSALVMVFGVVACVLASTAGVDGAVVAAFGVTWLTGVLALGLRIASRAPVLVVKVSADGTNQASWLLMVPFVLIALANILLGGPVLILLPAVAIALLAAVALRRGRNRVPDMLRALRPQLAEDEPVLGDGLGFAGNARSRHDAVRLVVATDRRVLLAGSPEPQERFVLVDVPYDRVSRFAIEWKLRGRIGQLSLTIDTSDGSPAETQRITSIAPANLVSIALALDANGVSADDPEAVAEAGRAWDEARRRSASRPRRIDRAAMRTRDFDRGLWLLLALSVITFYGSGFGVGPRLGEVSLVIVPLVIAAISLVGGYVSGTKASLAYLVPLNLLLCPVFFFAEAAGVIGVMVLVSAAAALGLWGGSALRRATAASPTAGAEPPRGGLRYAISGFALTRISGMLLIPMVTLAVIAASAGFDLSTLRLAIEEAQAKELPVDGRSDLTGNAASVTFSPGPGLKELVRDEDWGGGPNDGALWELRSPFREGRNNVSLAHYVFVDPRLDNDQAVADFVADKDDEHSRAAGHRVSHTEQVFDGRKGYVWEHANRRGGWQYAAWFPQPVHSVRLECIADSQEDRFRRLCDEAKKSLRFHDSR